MKEDGFHYPWDFVTHFSLQIPFLSSCYSLEWPRKSWEWHAREVHHQQHDSTTKIKNPDLKAKFLFRHFIRSVYFVVVVVVVVFLCKIYLSFQSTWLLKRIESKSVLCSKTVWKMAQVIKNGFFEQNMAKEGKSCKIRQHWQHMRLLKTIRYILDCESNTRKRSLTEDETLD